MIDKNFIKQALRKMVNGNQLIVNRHNKKFCLAYVGGSLFSKNINDFQFLLDEKLIAGVPINESKRSSTVFQITEKGMEYLEEIKK